MKKTNYIISGLILIIIALLVIILVIINRFNQTMSLYSVHNNVPIQYSEKSDKKIIINKPEGSVSKVVGTSFVKDNKVINFYGEPVKNDAKPGSLEAPQESLPISINDLPKSAIRLVISEKDGYVPSEFTVKEGEVVTLALTSGDKYMHLLKFKDPSLSAVNVGVGGHQTRAIVFNAPKAGEYEFYCGIPGHKSNGEVGKMIVK